MAAMRAYVRQHDTHGWARSFLASLRGAPSGGMLDGVPWPPPALHRRNRPAVLNVHSGSLT